MKNKKDVKKINKKKLFFVQHKHKESKKNILEIYINNMQCFLIYYLGGGGVKYDSILFGTILVLLLVVFIGLLSLKSEDTNDARIRVR